MKQIQEITGTSNIEDFLPAFVDQVMEIVLPSLLSKNRYVLQMGCNVLLQSQSDSTMSNIFELLMKRLFDIRHDDPDWKKAADKALAEYLNPEVGRAQPLEQESVEVEFEAFLSRSHSAFGKVLSVEQSLVDKLRIMSQARPLLVYSDTSGALDVVDILCDMARSSQLPCPKYICSSLLASSEVAALILNCKKERRWLIIDNFNLITNEVVETMPSTVAGGHRLFLIASHDAFTSPSISMHSKVSYISLTHAPIPDIRRCLYFSLLSLRIEGAKAKPFLDGILKLHEYLTEGQPNCDQYRYLNIFVKKWRWVDKTPEDVQNLVNEVYGIDVSSDDFLKSILREISYAID